MRIELLFLPSYSPHLNLIKRLWMFVKKQALHSRHHTHYADFHAAIETCLGELSTTHKTALHSLITLNSQTVEQCAIDSRVRDNGLSSLQQNSIAFCARHNIRSIGL